MSVFWCSNARVYVCLCVCLCVCFESTHVSHPKSHEYRYPSTTVQYVKLNWYADMVRLPLTPLDREKLVALITIEVWCIYS